MSNDKPTDARAELLELAQRIAEMRAASKGRAMQSIRIVLSLEQRAGDANSVLVTHTIRRSLIGAGLILELQGYWRALRELARTRQCTPFVYFHSHDGSRCVAMRDPPFTELERPEGERALTIIEALSKVTRRHQWPPRKLPRGPRR